jgi:hypothetical protein
MGLSMDKGWKHRSLWQHHRRHASNLPERGRTASSKGDGIVLATLERAMGSGVFEVAMRFRFRLPIFD